MLKFAKIMTLTLILAACSSTATQGTASSPVTKTVLDEAVALYQKKEYTTALSRFQVADASGHMQAARYIGLMYLNGEGVKKDNTVAFTQFKRAAELGDMTAQYWLAHCYENGIGTQKNLDLAKQWYIKSAQRADHVYAPALYALGRWYETGVAGVTNRDRAMQYYQVAAAAGDEDAKKALARLTTATTTPSPKK